MTEIALASPLAAFALRYFGRGSILVRIVTRYPPRFDLAGLERHAVLDHVVRSAGVLDLAGGVGHLACVPVGVSGCVERGRDRP
jgi:hypothetical protein